MLVNLIFNICKNLGQTCIKFTKIFKYWIMYSNFLQILNANIYGKHSVICVNKMIVKFKISYLLKHTIISYSIVMIEILIWNIIDTSKSLTKIRCFIFDQGVTSLNFYQKMARVHFCHSLKSANFVDACNLYTFMAFTFIWILQKMYMNI